MGLRDVAKIAKEAAKVVRETEKNGTGKRIDNGKTKSVSTKK